MLELQESIEGSLEKAKAYKIGRTLREKLEKNEYDYPTSTGFKKIDKIYRGFKPGQLIILGGRTSMGKTTVALNFVYKLLQNNKRVLYFDLEEEQEENITRLYTIHTQYPFKDYLDNSEVGEYKKKEVIYKLNQAEKWLESREFYYFNEARLSVEEIKQKIELFDSADLVIIDHLTRIKSPVYGNSYEKITETANQLKELTGILQDIPIMVLAQVGREHDRRNQHNKTPLPPSLSDLKGSGEIEQNATVVMFIHRDSYYKKDKGDFYEALEEDISLVIAKQKGAKTGTTNLIWKPSLNTIIDK